MYDKQLTLGEASSVRQSKGLTENQRKIIALVGEQLCQADIARKLGFSRAYVCQQVKNLESLKELKAVDIYPQQKGRRGYTKFYELSPTLKAKVKGERTADPITSCRVHNLRKKFPWSSDKEVSTDKRAGWTKSWKMQGPLRHKYWYSGQAGLPSVTIDVHPKTLVIYVDRKQFIPAKTPAEAQEIGWRAIYAALDQFVEKQLQFNVKVDCSHTGTTIGKPHGGFVGTDSPIMKEGVTLDRWWIDKSVESEVGPGKLELETDKPDGMTRLDNLIKLSENPQDMFKSVIDPLNQNVLQVQAMLQGSITNQQMLENVTKLISSVLVEMQSIRAENAELKARLGL